MEVEEMRSLEGRVALVTGASRGIGRTIALELARAGARVALNYRSGEAEATAAANEILSMRTGAPASRQTGDSSARALADEVASRIGVAVASSGQSGVGIMATESVMLAQGDVSVSEEARSVVQRVVDRWGRLDILVNNAGITRDKTLRKLDDQDWQEVLDTNLNSVYFCTSAAVPVMIDQKFGRIVNISSIIGQTGNFGQSNYSAAKGGMIAFAKSAALELARHNITVNCVCPGFIATEMLGKVPENVQETVKAKIPLSRFGTPEDVAKATLFLVSDADYITGQQINVNGGLYM
jgi:acetoacetyl-CoA reductase